MHGVGAFFLEFVNSGTPNPHDSATRWTVTTMIARVLSNTANKSSAKQTPLTGTHYATTSMEPQNLRESLIRAKHNIATSSP